MGKTLTDALGTLVVVILALWIYNSFLAARTATATTPKAATLKDQVAEMLEQEGF